MAPRPSPEASVVTMVGQLGKKVKCREITKTLMDSIHCSLLLFAPYPRVVFAR